MAIATGGSATIEGELMGHISTANIEEAIRRVIDEQIALVKEELIQDALKKYEIRVREIVGSVAVNTAKFYSVEHIGTMLHVRIQTGE